jgi:hypothetical protein
MLGMNNDEPASRIENAVRSNQPLQLIMLGAIAARIQHDVVAFWCQRAMRFPNQPRVANNLARLHPEIAEAEFAIALRPTHEPESSRTWYKRQCRFDGWRKCQPVYQ